MLTEWTKARGGGVGLPFKWEPNEPHGLSPILSWFREATGFFLTENLLL